MGSQARSSMSDLRSEANTIPREQRRHSSTDFPQTVSTLPGISRHKTLTESPTGTRRRFHQTSFSESEEVAGRVRSLPTTPAMTLTVPIGPHPHDLSSLPLNKSGFLEKQGMKRLTNSLDLRRHHYPRVFQMGTKPTLMKFSKNAAHCPRLAENKLQTRILLASGLTSG